MDHEFEAKYVVESIADARQRLERIGARCVQPERMLRRAVFDFPDGSLDRRGAWVRVRDEGDRVTMSYKQAPERSTIADCFETELVIDSYENGVELFEDLGMVRKSYQETRRESWETEDANPAVQLRTGLSRDANSKLSCRAKFDIDTWPGISVFIEVEAANEEMVRRYVEQLGFAWSDALFGGVGVIYQRELGLPEQEVNRIPEITFAKPPKRQ